MTGGGHWGGGMFINAYDMARFGYLTLHRGTMEGPPAALGAVGGQGAHADRAAIPTTAS